MSKKPAVGSLPPVGDIAFATLENRYLSKYRGVPQTPYLLIVEGFDEHGVIFSKRIVGITNQERVSLERLGVQFVSANANLDAYVDNYFTTSWAHLWTQYRSAATVAPLSNRIQ
jgi:hypothetical protein